MLLNPLTFHTPQALDEALKVYSHCAGNVRLQAGGTFLLNSLKLLKRKGAKTPENVISLRRIKELQEISADQNEMKIGSMVILDDVFESPLLTDNFAIFRNVCRNISTQPIRNMATVGGNLSCRYTWTEMPAVMIGLGAQMCFRGLDGEEVISAEEFYKREAKTNKILVSVTIKRDKECFIVYRRVSKSLGVDIPLLSLIIKTSFQNNQFNNTIVAVNNCVQFAQRDSILETFLNGKAISSKIPSEALDHLDEKIYDTRSGDYKKHMFRVSIKSALAELVQNHRENMKVRVNY